MTWMLQDEAANPYLDVCQYAAKSDEFFKSFKSHPAYTHVLEHVSYEEGKQYLKEIDIDYFDKLQEIKQNDAMGNHILMSIHQLEKYLLLQLDTLKIHLIL